MARKLLALALATLLALAAPCAAQIEAEDVQAFINVIHMKAGEVKTVAEAQAPVALASMEEITNNVLEMANLMWGIEWVSNAQSSWSQFVMYANTLVQRIVQIKDMLPVNSGNTWGSIYPQDDLMSVASAICTQVDAMQAAAEKQYSINLDIVPLYACDGLPGTAAAPAPAPAMARKLLA